MIRHIITHGKIRDHLSIKSVKKIKSVERPKFSIVIPAYNEADYIVKTLESITKLLNSHKVEIIVVDNNCTDNTAEIAMAYGARIATESNPGVCWARQAGTKEAKGEIVISTDADTTFETDWLINIEKAFSEDNSLVAVAGPCQYVEGPLWAGMYTRILFSLVSLGYKLFKRTFYVSAANIAFKKSAWTAYDTGLTQGGDELNLLHNLKMAGKVKFLPKNLVKTSSRRLTRGFFYSLFISFLLYYIVEYNLSRILGRPIFGHAPKFRDDYRPKVTPPVRAVVIIGLLALAGIHSHTVYDRIVVFSTYIEKNMLINSPKI